ncbi:hypothetical protein PGT21_004868 [Puccinia graminis f. sp. tritici]|uniref:Uncharacterized protein n=1 Tax=Puccinia graminis f. sp. tritici TaxID=56615 RepID=A0A5B0NC66_PUCGR|nr:hypothetical protein PGT21_004868 [Puccinia graminis f. sp. tritici]
MCDELSKNQRDRWLPRSTPPLPSGLLTLLLDPHPHIRIRKTPGHLHPRSYGLAGLAYPISADLGIIETCEQGLIPGGPGRHIDEFKGCGEIQLRLSEVGQHETRKKMLEEHLEEWYHGPVSSPEPDTPEFKQFNRLQEYYNTRCSNRYLDRPDCVPKKDIHTHFHSSLLPLLKQHFNSVAEVLGDLIELRKDPAPRIQRVLEIQPYLHQTLDQMIRIIDDIIPRKST